MEGIDWQGTLWGDSNALGLDGGLVTREYVFVKARGIRHLGLVYLITCKFHLKDIREKKERGRKGRKEGKEGTQGGREGGRERETINKY